jgi:dinuclear metal center YbgI/SA1388 family protein
MATAMNKALEILEGIAPLHYAESWDKVGLLVEPRRSRRLRNLFLTIDLTQEVLEEALDLNSDLICAYHPPIFRPLERFRSSRTGERIAMEVLRSGAALYSPHTALDAAPGGINDWLAEAFTIDEGSLRPLQTRNETTEGQELKLVVFVPADRADDLRRSLSEAGAGTIGRYVECSFNLEGRGTFRGQAGSRPAVGRAGRLESVDEVRMEMVASRSDLGALVEIIRRDHPYEEPAWEAYPLESRPQVGVGPGRQLRLREPTVLTALVRRVKRHLGLKRLRVAAAPRHRDDGETLSTIALCAGAGGSVLEGRRADLYLTGEMRHHDVLAANAAGISVILCDHTNTERGYLPRLAERLEKALGEGVAIHLSQCDRDPLEIV